MPFLEAPTLISAIGSAAAGRNKASDDLLCRHSCRGAAVGYGLGGWLLTLNGDDWRPGFQVVGLPELPIAFAALLLPEPPRVATELADDGSARAANAAAVLSVGVYLIAKRNRSHVCRIPSEWR